MGLFTQKKRNASEMEYKHKLQRAREKLRLVREEPQRAWKKRRLGRKEPQCVWEKPTRSP